MSLSSGNTTTGEQKVEPRWGSWPNLLTRPPRVCPRSAQTGHKCGSAEDKAWKYRWSKTQLGLSRSSGYLMKHAETEACKASKHHCRDQGKECLPWRRSFTHLTGDGDGLSAYSTDLQPLTRAAIMFCSPASPRSPSWQSWKFMMLMVCGWTHVTAFELRVTAHSSSWQFVCLSRLTWNDICI